MRKIVCLVLILLLLATGPAVAQIGRDKYMHTGVCATISFTTDLALAQIWPEIPGLYRMLAAVSASMLVGLGKEYVLDEKADPQDLVADFVGALAGVGISFSLEW